MPRITFSKKVKRVVLITIVLTWLVLMLGGTAVYWGYENRPGIAAEAPGNWPAASRIVRYGDRSTLIIIAHPHCPCTRATLHELARLMSDQRDGLLAYVIFVRPDGVDDDWAQTDTWASAAKIPGVTVLEDGLGVEAAMFDAHTSGQAMLYGKDGTLLFTGGITSGRGKQGVSMGESAITAILSGLRPPVEATNVYGCPLLRDEAYCRVGQGTN